MISKLLQDNIIKTETLKESKIQEETAAQKFAEETPETAEGESIEDILNDCEDLALDNIADMESRARNNITSATAKRTFGGNPLFVGPTGTGKTSIITTWARDKGYEIITLNMMGDALDFLGVKTINRDYELPVDDEGNTKKVARVSTVATQAFDPFLRGKMKVLFLDEINKTNPTILQSLYDLISFHSIQNGDERMFLPKLLFVVGAMNPSEYGGGREVLDSALKARMSIYQVTYDIPALKTYMLKEYDKSIESITKDIEKLKGKENNPEFETLSRRYKKYCGRRDLADALLSDKKFQFTDAETIASADELEPVFTPRTFEEALRQSDGTRMSLLKKIGINCGKDAEARVANILTKYQDKQHKANEIWGKDYSVKSSVEDEIADSASDEEKAKSELATNMLQKMKNLARN